MILFVRLIVPLVVLVFAIFPGSTAHAEHPLRIWRNTEGRALEARLVSASPESVILKLKDGREATVPLKSLSPADQKSVAELLRKGLAFAVQPLPEETRLPDTVNVQGGPLVFQTPNFQFETGQKVSHSFIAETSKVFEGTLLAIQSLPLGLEPHPPEGMDRFRALFLDRSVFMREIGDSIPVVPGQSVAGVYVPARKEILVPYESVGAVRRGSQLSLRKTSDTSTLVHEITHQVMHDWLNITPMWLVEGMAEYMAAVPYFNGKFAFRSAGRGLEERLKEKYRTGTPTIIHPSWLFHASPAEWRGTLEEYMSSMVLVYYFIHLDRKGQGEAMAAYLRMLRDAQSDTEHFIAEYNQAVSEFEKKRQEYNRAVESYKAGMEAFKRQAEAYNNRIRSYNEQATQGVAEEKRVRVGEKPKAPNPPADIVVPEVLKNFRPEGPIDIFRVANEKAYPALTRDRSLDELAEDIRQAFQNEGIEIRMTPGIPADAKPPAKQG